MAGESDSPMVEHLYKVLVIGDFGVGEYTNHISSVQCCFLHLSLHYRDASMLHNPRQGKKTLHVIILYKLHINNTSFFCVGPGTSTKEK